MGRKLSQIVTLPKFSEKDCVCCILLFRIICHIMNTIRLGNIFPGVFDTPDILNLHLFIRASHIFVNMSGHRLQWKTEAQVR